MSTYRDLDVKDDKPVVESWDDVAEQRVGLNPLLQPGDYEFQLPDAGVLDRAWEVLECKVRGADVQRLKLQFGGECPLLVVGGRGHKGDLWYGRLTTQERNRSRQGEPERFASDLDYLLRDGLKHAGAKPTKQKQYGEALSSHGGETFIATNDWSASCNDARVRYISEVNEAGEETGRSIEDPDGTKGCGEKYYMKHLTPLRDDKGIYPEQIACKCGAVLRPFQNLGRFRPGTKPKATE